MATLEEHEALLQNCRTKRAAKGVELGDISPMIRAVLQLIVSTNRPLQLRNGRSSTAATICCDSRPEPDAYRIRFVPDREGDVRVQMRGTRPHGSGWRTIEFRPEGTQYRRIIDGETASSSLLTLQEFRDEILRVLGQISAAS